MSRPKYTKEFKDEAVRQVTERNYPAKEVAERLGRFQESHLPGNHPPTSL